jgi:DNA-binding CsgD family transcriptional regulator
VAATSTGKPQYERRADTGPAPNLTDGVILLDARMNVLAYDDGAASILQISRGRQNPDVPFSQPIIALLQETGADSHSRKSRVELRGKGYICRVHPAHACIEGFPGAVTVLHIAREANMDDALTRISTEYGLTGRERQAVQGILSGLSSKEVARQMGISPNTVKAFLRLAMGRMGVSSRTGIIAKLFAPNGQE